MLKGLLLLVLMLPFLAFSQGVDNAIYQDGWIDLNKNGRKDVYEDPNVDIEKRIKHLISIMTLEEKTAQMATLYGYGRVLKDELPTDQWKNEVWKDGIGNIDEHLNSLAYHPDAQTDLSFPYSRHAEAINTVQRWFVEETRLGIPVDFSNEGIHGLNHDRATPLPAPIAIGSTWNKALVRQAGQIAGKEARALGYTNVYAPILDLARDPRWGRVVETYGEDPFHVAELGLQMALGIQEEGAASTVKHFAAYSVPKGGRDGGARTDPHIAPRELHEIHLYPFRRVIMEADVLGVMSSYNDWDGVPVTGSAYFLTELLRKQYGFRGFVVSDSEAVEYLESKHHVAGDYKEAVRQSVEAGLNVRTTFREPASFIEPLRDLVREGSISMETIDSRVSDVLRVKFELGLFDQPYVEDPSRADQVVYDKDAQLFSKRISRESLVLLKNENHILPLDKKAVKRVLVTGPNAAAIHHSISRYGPSNIDVISVLEGVKAIGGSDFEVVYTKGSDIANENWPTTEILPESPSPTEQLEITKAVELAKESDIIIAVLGENEKIVGESLSRTSLDLPGIQQDLLKALYDTGKPVILVLINGRALTINWADKYVPGILEAWFPGEYGGMAIAEALFGDYNPGGKLSVTFPKTVGQIEYNFPYKPGSHASQPERDPNNAGYNTRIDGFLYPFGFGLSYTSFEYSNLVVTPNEAGAGNSIQVQVEVSNTGSRAGDEVVQLYLSDPVSTVTTYVSLLRGFERMHLKPGETKTVKFELSPDDLSILDKDMKWGVEPGYYEVWIGASSEDIRLKERFEIVE